MAAPFELRTYPKNDQRKLSAHFWAYEFDCPCNDPECRTTLVDDELVFMLQRLRDWLLQPVNITSAYRCQAHQDAIERAGYPTAKNSQHLKGRAVDIWSSKYNGPALEIEARQVGFSAVGVGAQFIHVDLRNDKRRRWTYTA